ncbi:hypothetical protein NC653_011593 [Populus alba x Populus x berolinensis]|uniref:Uncharacterized protein n=1 Tax=Populus alba x Populus x berolinensis TaxID=444605 RepID=A0AAD6R2X6_9ROSI|nr:hypothetical protein NC653_011593 [Populus alba x Populus x berolinensis]
MRTNKHRMQVSQGGEKFDNGGKRCLDKELFHAGGSDDDTQVRRSQGRYQKLPRKLPEQMQIL